MHIISRKALLEFGETEKQAVVPLDNWYRTAKKAVWKNLIEVQDNYPHADLVGKCTVFNIGGNKYRLITKIEYLKQAIYIKSVLTHVEYDKDSWKENC